MISWATSKESADHTWPTDRRLVTPGLVLRLYGNSGKISQIDIKMG